MALVQYGGGVLDMRGSIGGQVHSKNRSGSYIRARTTPVNPGTDRQSVVRAAVAALATRWSSVVTAAQRAGWEVYAANITRVNKLGAQIKLTGFNMFIRSNVPRVQTGSPNVDVAPVDLTLPGQDPAFACTIDEAGQEISVVFDDALPWCTQATGRFFVSMSLPHNDSVNFIGGPFRHADTIVGIDPGGAVSPAVIAVPFPVAEGQQVKCSARISEEDGRLSDPFFDQLAVVA